MKTLMTSTLLALFAVISNVSTVVAQPTEAEVEAAYEKAYEQLKDNINGMTQDVFLREKKLDSGRSIIELLWEMNGEATKFTIELRDLGYYSSKPLFGIFAYSVVAESSKGTMPPAVIKAVTTANESTGLGYFSMPKSFDVVYVNTTMPSDTLNPGQLWITLAYMHQNRLAFKEEVESLMGASGR